MTRPGAMQSVFEPSFHCSRCAVAIRSPPPQRIRSTETRQLELEGQNVLELFLDRAEAELA